MKQFKEKYLDSSKKLKILDLGSQDINGCYAHLFKEPNWIYQGADMSEGKNVNIKLSNPYDWENIESETYDVVISGQTFEHIEFFWITILQINRVLKIGGVTCIIAPADGYEHRFPTDCWRYYPDGLKALAKWGKMEVLESTTQWEPHNCYSDDSDLWKDSMLVSKKTVKTPEIENMLYSLKSWL